MSNPVKFYFQGDKIEFANLLNKIGVLAYSTKDYVALDLEALERIPCRELPVWVWANWKDLHNRFKTFPCHPMEWPPTRWDHIVLDGRYILVVFCENLNKEIMETHARSEFFDRLSEAKAAAEERAAMYRKRIEPDTKFKEVSVVVVERATGDMVYTAQV